MNVLIASVDAFPRMGGISTMGHHLANALAYEGHGVVFLGPKGTHVPTGYRQDYRLIEDFESNSSRRSGETASVEDRRVRDLASGILERYSIDRVLLLHPFYYAIGLLDECGRRSIPVSAYFHGFELRSQLRSGYPRSHESLIRKRRVTTLRERVFYTVGACDEILVNSRFTSRLLDGFKICPPVRVTGCGIPELVWEQEKALSPRYDPVAKRAMRRRAGLPEGTCLSFVGRLVPTKRADRLVELCTHSEELSAIIVGEGPERDRLVSMISERGLADRVRLVGGVSEREKWEILRSSDFIVLPSEPDEEKGQVEGFGIVLLEGAASGAIPLSSGTGGMVDVVEDGVTGVVLRDFDASDAVSLVELARQPSQMERLLSGARQQLEERYTWASVARGIVSAW